MQIRKLIVAAGMSLIFVSTYSAAKKRGRRGVTLEDPESVSLKKVCRSYARICARYPPLARLSGRNTKNDLLVSQTPGHSGCRFFLRAASVDLFEELERRIVCGDRAMETLPLDRRGVAPLGITAA